MNIGDCHKEVKCANYITYSRKEYDFQANTLIFVSPGQVFGYPEDGSTDIQNFYKITQ